VRLTTSLSGAGAFYSHCCSRASGISETKRGLKERAIVRRRSLGLSVTPLLFLALFLAATAAAQTQPAGSSGEPGQEPGSTANRPSDSTGRASYVIGPSDVLAITVWKDADLTKTMPVRPDGNISLPLIGDLRASGLTAMQLQDVITQKLKAYVTNPEVNVVVEEVKSRSFNIVGKVFKPGSYELAKPTTVLDAIALAGGFQDFAKVTKVYVLRRGPDGSQKMLHFNYKQVIKGQALDQNVQLQPGDTVVAP
jgi:polysaccharide biosynthesis/export protein